MRATLADELDQQAVKGFHLDMREVFGRDPDHLHALVEIEDRMLLWIEGHGDIHSIEEAQASGDQIDVPIRNRIEGSGVHADLHEACISMSAN